MSETTVRENLKAGKYKNTLPYKYERVPVDEDVMTVTQAKAHLAAEKTKENEHRQQYRAEDQRLVALLRADLEEQYGFKDHPKRDKLWDKSWSDGHSSGLDEVVNCYETLMELMA